ncbi:hypothetical protein GCM10010873_01710 [Cypionkella aquatica]|uniref:Uncharacterized protein n=1 Tax=Cypionkella aquatica TaxID=1756042 RepID=A0AA37TQJ1_9RHOB|nr:hypothetical protein [Cypionkella aquatica]GLS85198.1 hypothetical protein GCM10010873_01710 [Cypionkella aquatica]
MIRFAFAFWLVLLNAAAADPVLVKSGEHDGFTRLVLEFESPVDWQVGRTDDGYLLHVRNVSPNYDFSQAFKAIGKGRLAGISSDPDSGDLQLAVACACYAIPFEFRPGIVVIDLKDGKPPKGSSFEEPLAARHKPESAKLPVPHYDWAQNVVLDLRAEREPIPQATLAPPPSSDPALQTLRESLLHQLSRGASQGVIDIAITPAASADTENHAPASARIGLGELPGLSVTDGLPTHDTIGAEGQNCIDPERLAVSTWGDDTPIFAQMAASSQGLVGEFDQQDDLILERAIRFHLFIGFGAEAKQLLLAFPGDQPDRAIWQSMANLVDGNPDPQSAFLAQQSCDGPSALWAILAQDNLKDAHGVNTNAAFLAFSALPIGLRRGLGPTLADRLMAVGATDVAMRVRDAILRAPGGAGSETSLLQAKLEMYQGQPAIAEATLKTMVVDPGPGTPAALVALIEAQVAQDLPVDPNIVTALEAVVAEQPDLAAAPAALLLAKAASGDLDGAFALLPTAPETEPKLWRILALLGTDDEILRHAVLPREAAMPASQPDAGPMLAKRLLNLGLADASLQWLDAETTADPLLLATIHLQRRDGRAVVRVLTGENSKPALVLRAQAMQQIGDEAAAALIYAQAGDAIAESRALAKSENWQQVSLRGEEHWKQAASALIQPAASGAAGDGPLAEGKRLIDNSDATLGVVQSLLAQVEAP